MKKKILILASLLFVVAFTLTGCNSKELIDEVKENMSKVTNGNIEMKMNMKFNTQGLNMEMPFDIKTKIFDEKTYMNMSMTFMEQTINTEMYMLMEGNKVTTYVYDSYTEEWYKIEETLDESASDEELFNIISNTNNIKELVNESKGDIKVYEATLTKKQLEEILSLFQVEEAFEFDINDNSTIKFSVNMKTKLLETLNLNFEDSIKMNTDGVEFIGGFTLDITFKDLNKVSNFNIPQEALNAVSYE